MKLKSKQIEYIAIQVKEVAKAIKENKGRELPVSFYHAFQRGDIYVGVGNNLLVLIDDKYQLVSFTDYLLTNGGTIKVEPSYLSIRYKYDIVEEMEEDQEKLWEEANIVGDKEDFFSKFRISRKN